MVITAVAALMTLPALAYLGANLIEWASGTEGNSGVFGATFDSWSSLGLTLLVAGGPLLALAVVLASSLRVRRADRAEGFVQATVDVRMPNSRFRMAVASLLLLGGTVAYWFSQNWPCLYGNQLTC